MLSYFATHQVSFCIGPVLVEFVDLPNGQASAGINESLVIPFYLFGSPEPQLTLLKQASNPANGYSVVNDPRIVISLSEVSFTSLDFKDEGSYMIVTNNIEGNFSISFTVDVTGVKGIINNNRLSRSVL